MKLFTVTLVLVLGVVSPAVAAERQVVVLTSTDTDDRLSATREAITFWNEVFSELGLETRLGHPDVVIGSAVERLLENYARRVSQRAVRLPAGSAEPDPPQALTKPRCGHRRPIVTSGHHGRSPGHCRGSTLHGIS